MSKASGGKVTTLKELKTEWILGALLSLLNSLGNPIGAEIISLPGEMGSQASEQTRHGQHPVPQA